MRRVQSAQCSQRRMQNSVGEEGGRREAADGGRVGVLEAAGGGVGEEGEEGEEGNLDAGVMEDAGRGEQQHQPDHQVTGVGGLGHHHRLADEAAEKGKGGDGGGAHYAKTAGPRHRLVEPTQIRAVHRARAQQHGSHRHEQQALENYVVEGMRHRPIDAHAGAQPDTGHHEADLVYHAVSQHPAQVVLDHGVEDREHGQMRS